MSQTIDIARARADDVADIFRIRTSVVENHLDLHQLAAMGITFATIAELLEADPCGWIARLDGEAAGFAMIDRQEGELFALFVLPALEGKGIGRALLRVAEAALFRDHSLLRLETAAGGRAERFYRSSGWEVEHTAGGQSGDAQAAGEKSAGEQSAGQDVTMTRRRPAQDLSA